MLMKRVIDLGKRLMIRSSRPAVTRGGSGERINQGGGRKLDTFECPVFDKLTKQDSRIERRESAKKNVETKREQLKTKITGNTGQHIYVIDTQWFYTSAVGFLRYTLKNK